MNIITNWLSNNEALVAVITIALAVHTVLKAVFDALTNLRAELDKTPATDDNALEKLHTKFGVAMKFLNNIALYLVGIRKK